MERIRRILVALHEPRRAGTAAIRRAAQLARATGATVELFHAVGEPRMAVQRVGGRSILRHLSVEHSVEAARRELERVARTKILQGCRTSVTAVWDTPAHEAIVRRATATRASLVIIGSRARSLAGRLALRNTDWELIRSCPVPLLLARPVRARRNVVLAAVDPFHANAKPAGLDARLVDAGAGMARLLKGELHLFHAYLPLGVIMSTSLPEPMVWDSAEAEQHHARAVEREFGRLAVKAGVAPGRRHLCMGGVATELYETVRKLGATLVVMGAVSRSRLQRWFIGSTAERVLDGLACDALIIKPRAGTGSRRAARVPPPRHGMNRTGNT
ncbi:MAG TPA: universal stress protein [Steroidobacteraceae bacterium]|nr:universal stress protein [Steroidobacteraceae bacterium]